MVCGWASSNQLKSWREQSLTSPWRRGTSGTDSLWPWTAKLPWVSSLPAHPPNFRLSKPTQSFEPILDNKSWKINRYIDGYGYRHWLWIDVGASPAYCYLYAHIPLVLSPSHREGAGSPQSSLSLSLILESMFSPRIISLGPNPISYSVLLVSESKAPWGLNSQWCWGIWSGYLLRFSRQTHLPG